MSLNRVMLIGNVGKDPDIRYVDKGVCTAQLRLATSVPGYTLPNGTQVPERTEWHTILLWRRLAEVAERYVHKGDKLYVEGELRYRTYTDRKGLTHNVAEVWCTNLELLTSRQQAAGPITPTAPGQPPFGTPTAQPQGAVQQTVRPQQKSPKEECPF